MKPEGLHFGLFHVGWYAVMLAAGFIAGAWTGARRMRRAGLPQIWLADLFLITLIAAIAGARLWHVAENWPQFQRAPWEILYLRQGGLVYYGGFFGATAAVIWYARWRRISFWQVADILAPSVALGYAFTRVGCFLNGCCWGHPTNVPWAVCFPLSHPTHGVPVHPAQLYSVILNLGLFLALEKIFNEHKYHGQVVGWYFLAYGFLRFIAEFFRGDISHDWLGLFTLAQLVSLGLIGLGTLILWRLCLVPAGPVKTAI